MTISTCRETLTRYERFLDSIEPKAKDREMVRHLRGMIPDMEAMLDSAVHSAYSTEKFMRWLGFIQGVFWQRKWFTLDELKEHNRL